MTTATDKKAKKPERRPCFTVGARVTTRYAVKAPKRVLRRQFLYLLPGCEWTVTAVECDGKRAPVYTLTAGEFTIRRAEWRLKALAK